MTRLLPLAVLVAALLFALSPVLTDGFGGFDPNRFPVPQIDPPAQPAGWAFAIWGVIYLGLIAHAAYGLLRRSAEPGWDAVRWPLLASLMPGIFWIPVAQVSPVWSTAMIFWMMSAALLALWRTGRAEALFQRAPIALYAGWLTAATGVAFAVTLAGHGVMNEQAAALLCLGASVVVAAFMQWRRPDALAYGGGVSWALIGVIADNLAPLNVAVVSLAVVGIAALATIIFARRSPMMTAAR